MTTSLSPQPRHHRYNRRDLARTAGSAIFAKRKLPGNVMSVMWACVCRYTGTASRSTTISLDIVRKKEPKKNKSKRPGFTNFIAVA